MRGRLNQLLIVSLLLASSPAWADGLVYQLPEDGAWVKYDMTMTRGQGAQARALKASFTMASVGQVTEGGKKCRWIEMRYVLVRNHITAKVLIPEKELTKGGHAMANIVRGQIKLGKRALQAVSVRNRGPMPLFLAGPLEKTTVLDGQDLDTALGKLSCKGITGELNYVERAARKKVSFTVRLNEKAPFGVISAHIREQTRQGVGGAFSSERTIEMNLVETGTGAKTQLPKVK